MSPRDQGCAVTLVGLAWVATGGCTRAPSGPEIGESAVSLAPPPAEAAVLVVSPLDASGPALAPGDAERLFVDASAATATDAGSAPRPRSRKGRGVGCVRDGECAAGLACCESGFRGHCGGANMPDVDYPPCVLTSSCQPAPCVPLAMPP